MSDEQSVEAKIEQTLFPSEEAPVEEAPVAVAEEAPEMAEAAPAEEVDTTESAPEMTEEADPVEEEDVETLAAVLGLSDEQVEITEKGDILINAMVDNEQVQVPFKDIIAAYQGTEYATKRAEEVVQQRETLDKEIEEARQTAQAKLEQMQTVSKLMEQELLQDYNSHNWQELSMHNPAEYHRLREQYTQKAHRIKELQATLSKEGEQQRQEMLQMQKHRFDKLMESESAKMLAANPTWHNPAVREKDFTELRNFLKETYQYSDDEINQIVDHRLVKLIQDAYKNKAPQATTQGKKVVPAFGSATANRVAAAANARAAKARKAALRKSGSQAALTQVLLDRV